MVTVLNRTATLLGALCVFLSVSAASCIDAFSDRLSDTFYVAGSGEVSPLEYTENGVYAGEIPELLEKIGAETGMRFVYLPIQKESTPLESGKNLQAELLSCMVVREEEKASLREAGIDLSKALYIIRYDASPDAEVCFGFTPIFAGEDRARFTSALEKLTPSEPVILGAGDLNAAEDRVPYAGMTAAALTAAAALIISVLLIKKGDSKETGPADPDAFRDAVDRACSEADALSYIALFETENGGERILRVTSGEKTGCMSCLLPEGSIALLYTALNVQNAADIVKQTAEVLEASAAAVVPVRDAGLDSGLLIKCARNALSEAAKINDRIFFCTDTVLDRMRKRVLLESQLHTALKNEQFELYLQPIVRTSDGKPVGAEALSRWDHPRLGFLTPSNFISLVRELDMEEEFDRFQLRRVCSELSEWRKKGREDLYIHCNVSRKTMSRQDFPEYLESLVREYDIPTKMLITEITEEQYSAMELVMKNIRELKNRGFVFALDDYGTGDTWEEQISSGLFDCIKIDALLLKEAFSEHGRLRLEQTLELTHLAGAKAVCEGIENAGQAKLLKELGCDLSQGFFYYRPMPEQIVAKILMDGKF